MTGNAEVPTAQAIGKAEGPDLEADLEERPAGGLGIHLIKKMMDEITYDYQGNTNIVTLLKRIGTK